MLGRAAHSSRHHSFSLLPSNLPLLLSAYVLIVALLFATDPSLDNLVRRWPIKVTKSAYIGTALGMTEACRVLGGRVIVRNLMCFATSN